MVVAGIMRLEQSRVNVGRKGVGVKATVVATGQGIQVGGGKMSNVNLGMEVVVVMYIYVLAIVVSIGAIDL